MIKVGDRVRRTGTNRSGTVVQEAEDAVKVYFHEPANLSGYINWELRRDLVATPPASQDWTPHDRYTAAALTGLLARGGDTVPIGGFVAVARQIADEAMAARGGK